MRETRAWVEGYVLALEDMIKDIEELGGWDVVPDDLYVKVNSTLASAQKTLDTIDKINPDSGCAEQDR
jgi:methyl coenzyme M reductase subunit C-like uncharacterized protein (methanogenesis marker protein 7)